MDGVEDGAGVLEGAALAALGVAGTDPAGVEEPGVGVVLLDLVGEHAGVAHGVEGEEGLAEAGGEGGLGLGDTVLGTGHLGGVAGDEVEHGLATVELGDGGKDTAGVAGEEDDVGGVLLGDAGNLGVGDELDGVGTPRVLGEGGIIVVYYPGLGVENDVLKNGTEADSVENIGLLLAREANTLGVAAALNVEDASVAPAVLIITDEVTAGVGGKGGLAGAGETEEESDLSVLALVGGGVEGEDVVLDGHFVEENGEDTLLHLTSVLGTEDDHFLLGEVDGHGGAGGHALGESVGGELASIVDDVVGGEVLKLLTRGPDEHVPHEEGVVGASADNAHSDPVLLVPSRKTVNDVDSVSGVEVVNGTLAVDFPDLPESPC